MIRKNDRKSEVIEWSIFLFIRLILAILLFDYIVLIIVAIVRMIADSRGPSCHQFLRRRYPPSTILVPPTLQSTGQREVNCLCVRCSHRWNYKKAIPKLDNNPSRCPECYEMAERSVTLIVPPTSQSDGEQSVFCYCLHCSYHWSYDEIVKDNPAFSL